MVVDFCLRVLPNTRLVGHEQPNREQLWSRSRGSRGGQPRTPCSRHQLLRGSELLVYRRTVPGPLGGRRRGGFGRIALRNVGLLGRRRRQERRGVFRSGILQLEPWFLEERLAWTRNGAGSDECDGFAVAVCWWVCSARNTAFAVHRCNHSGLARFQLC